MVFFNSPVEFSETELPEEKGGNDLKAEQSVIIFTIHCYYEVPRGAGVNILYEKSAKVIFLSLHRIVHIYLLYFSTNWFKYIFPDLQTFFLFTFPFPLSSFSFAYFIFLPFSHARPLPPEGEGAYLPRIGTYTEQIPTDTVLFVDRDILPMRKDQR
jgi:hypothetical protein